MDRLDCDPYQTLGIARDATQREVKQAYRRLALKLHPDHNPEKPEATERFKQIQQAYETLSSRRKHRLLSQTDFYPKNHPPAVIQNEHPFFGFYRAMKIHGERMLKSMRSNRAGGDQEKNHDS